MTAAWLLTGPCLDGLSTIPILPNIWMSSNLSRKPMSKWRLGFYVVASPTLSKSPHPKPQFSYSYQFKNSGLKSKQLQSKFLNSGYSCGERHPKIRVILGTIAEEDGNKDQSKNHWAAIIKTPSRSLRFSICMNERTGQLGLLVLCHHIYVGPSANVVHRDWLKFFLHSLARGQMAAWVAPNYLSTVERTANKTS